MDTVQTPRPTTRVQGTPSSPAESWNLPVCPCSTTQLGHEWKLGLTAVEPVFKTRSWGAEGTLGRYLPLLLVAVPLRRVLCSLCLRRASW